MKTISKERTGFIGMGINEGWYMYTSIYWLEALEKSISLQVPFKKIVV